MKKFRRFIGIFTSAALIAALLLPMCALGGSAAEFKGYTVTTVLDFEDATDDTVKDLVSANMTGLDTVNPGAENKGFTVEAHVYAPEQADGKIGGGKKALKVTADKKADWPPTTFTLKLDGTKLKGAEALVFHIAADKQGEEGHMSGHVSLLTSDGTAIFPAVANPSPAVKAWNAETSQFEGRQVDEGGGAYYTYGINIDANGAWIYISLKAEDLKFSDDSKKDSFTPESVTGLRVGGQHFGADNAFYIDDVCTLVTAAEPEPEPEPETKLPAPADKAAVNFGGYSAKPLYDFEKYTAADAAKAVSVNTKELDNAQYTITGEIYEATGKDDGKVGAGKALKVTTEYTQPWPPCSATLAVDGASLKGAAGIVVHLAADTYNSDEHGIMVHLLTKDDGVIGPAIGDSSTGLKVWNADSSAFEGIQVLDNKLSYLQGGKLDAKGSWLFISLDQKNLIPLGATKMDGFAVENVTGLRISAQNLQKGNALYIDEVYALTPASGTSGGSSPATGDTVAFAVVAVLSAAALAVLLITGRRHAASK